MDFNNPKNRYQELDALRGIAALLVVFFHYTMNRPESELGFKLGTTGVDLFFIISGFVIYMSINRVNSSTHFIINRVSRLYPTYWTCVTITYLLIIIFPSFLNRETPLPNFHAYLGNMTMFQYYLRITDIDGPYWTMIIEMIFYIGILILFHFKMLRYLNIIGIVSSILLIILTTFFGHYIFLQKIMNWIPLLQFIPLFFAGTIFHKIYVQKTINLKYFAILLICLISQISLFNYAGRAHTFIQLNEYAMMLIIYFILFTFFVIGKLKFIVSRWTLFLGEISFALYLIHQYISVNILIPYLTTNLKINFWISAFGICLPIVLSIASIITYFIEIPGRKLMREKLSRMVNKNV